MMLTFVAVDASKEVSDNVQSSFRRMLSSKADNAHAIEEREDIGRDDLVNKHDGESCPKELCPLPVALGVEVQRCRTAENQRRYLLSAQRN
jgi:hypothetical protein